MRTAKKSKSSKSSKSTFRVFKSMKKKSCKYPDCVNYNPKSKAYCTLACAADHEDYKERQHVAFGRTYSIYATQGQGEVKIAGRQSRTRAQEIIERERGNFAAFGGSLRVVCDQTGINVTDDFIGNHGELWKYSVFSDAGKKLLGPATRSEVIAFLEETELPATTRIINNNKGQDVTDDFAIFSAKLSGKELITLGSKGRFQDVFFSSAENPGKRGSAIKFQNSYVADRMEENEANELAELLNTTVRSYLLGNEPKVIDKNWPRTGVPLNESEDLHSVFQTSPAKPSTDLINKIRDITVEKLQQSYDEHCQASYATAHKLAKLIIERVDDELLIEALLEVL